MNIIKKIFINFLLIKFKNEGNIYVIIFIGIYDYKLMFNFLIFIKIF